MTLFYEEWLRPQENISVGAGVVIGRTRSGPFMFGANPGARPGDEACTVDRAHESARSTSFAWRLGQAMCEARIRLAAADEGVVSSRAALVLLRTDRTIAFADETGEDLLVAEEECRLGRFAFRDALAERALATALRNLARSDTPVTLRVPRRDGWPALHFVGLDHGDVRRWPLATLLNVPQRCLLCVIGRPAAITRDSPLGRFGLTKAEQAVAEAIARGETTAAIAEQRNVRLAPVRRQVQAIYAKCGIRNRAALTALVLGARRSG